MYRESKKLWRCYKHIDKMAPGVEITPFVLLSIAAKGFGWESIERMPFQGLRDILMDLSNRAGKNYSQTDIDGIIKKWYEED